MVVALDSPSSLPRTFVIYGEAGVGKSRFSAEIADAARARGARVLTGSCVDLGGRSLPFGAITELLRPLGGGSGPRMLDDVPGTLDATGRSFPDLLAGAGYGAGAEGPDDLMRTRLFELILGVVTGLADSGSVVLIVEDLHWADRSTLDVLAFLHRNLHRGAIVSLLTYRSDEVNRRHPALPFLAELERSGRSERIELRRFDRTEMTEQLAGITGRPPTAELVERIRARSEGNAFLTEELLAATATDGPLPDTLQDVLFARMSALSSAAQHLLRVAAVAGAPVDARLLEVVMGADDTFGQTLRETLDASILLRERSTQDEAFGFRHALLRDAVYGDLLPGERTRLHASYARALGSPMDGVTEGRLAQLAYHAEASGDLERALPAAVGAGMAAADAFAFPEANAQYERALELWERVPAAEMHAGIGRVELLEKAAATAAAATIPTSTSRIMEAVALVEPLGDPIRTGLLYERLGRYRWLNGDGSGALEAYDRGMALVPSAPPNEARARVTAGLGQIRMILADFGDAIALCEEAVAAARSVGSHEVECHALNSLGVATAYLGEVDRGLEMLEHSIGIATAMGLVEDVARAYANMADVLGVSARFSDAIVIGLQCEEYASAHGLGSAYGSPGLCEAAGALYRTGRWDDAEAALARAQGYAARGVPEIDLHVRRAAIEVGRGHHAEAMGRLELVRQLSERSIDVQYLAPMTEVSAELAIWDGRPAEAERAIADVLARFPRWQGANISRFGPLYALAVRAAADCASLARLRRSQQDADAAASRGAAHLEAIRRAGAEIDRRWPVFRPLADAYLSLCDAESTRMQARHDPGPWATTIDAWDALGMPYPKAYASWRLAEALLASRGSRERAHASLREAHHTAVRLGAEPLRFAIESLAAMGRVDLGDGAPVSEAPFGLTAREREVLAHVASGLTNRQIGDRLFITEKTASVHVSNILGKLGVDTRGQAASVAHRLGLVDTEDS